MELYALILTVLLYIPTKIKMFFQKNNLNISSVSDFRLNNIAMAVFLIFLMLSHKEAVYIAVPYLFLSMIGTNYILAFMQFFYFRSFFGVFEINLNFILSISMLLSVAIAFQVLFSVFISGFLFNIKSIINKLFSKKIISEETNNLNLYVFENIENLTDNFILNNGKFIIITKKIESIEIYLKDTIINKSYQKFYIYELNSEVFNVIKEKKINYQITDDFNKIIFISFENKFISLIEAENTKKISSSNYIFDFYKNESLFNLFKFSLFTIEKLDKNLTRNGDIPSDEKKITLILNKIGKAFLTIFLLPVLMFNYIPYLIFSVIHSKNAYAKLSYEYIYSFVFIFYINYIFFRNDYIFYINILSYIIFWLMIYTLFGLFNFGNTFKNMLLTDADYIERKYNLIENITEANIEEIERKGFYINVFCLSFKDSENLKFFTTNYGDMFSYKFTNENFNYLLNNKNKKRFWHIVDKRGKVFFYGFPSGKMFIKQFKEENIKYYDDLKTQCYKEINFVDLFLNPDFYKNEKLKKSLKKLLNIYIIPN